MTKRKKISRRQALSKMTLKAASLTSLAVILSSPLKAQHEESEDSPDIPPDWP